MARPHVNPLRSAVGAGLDNYAASETGKVYPAAQIRVEPIQNLSLPAGEQLAYHTHLPGDKYAYNDGDGSTHYDLEHSLALDTDNDYAITAQQGQKILLRISNPSSAGYRTIRTLGIPMTIIAKGARLLKAPNGTRLYYQTSSITLGAGQSIDVIIDTTNVPPGTYFLYTTNMKHLTNLAYLHPANIAVRINTKTPPHPPKLVRRE